MIQILRKSTYNDFLRSDLKECLQGLFSDVKHGKV